MKTISRKEAKAAGLKYYFTGKPCKRGHISERFFSNKSCCKCEEQWRKQYIEENKERLAEWQKQYREENKERLAEMKKQWAQTPKGKASKKAVDHNRRARVRNADGSHTAKDIMQLFDDQRGKCACCKTKLNKSGKNKYHVDHIIPLAKGGSNDKYNLQLLCAPCNLSKSDKDPIEFMQSQGLLL